MSHSFICRRCGGSYSDYDEGDNTGFEGCINCYNDPLYSEAQLHQMPLPELIDVHTQNSYDCDTTDHVRPDIAGKKSPHCCEKTRQTRNEILCRFNQLTAERDAALKVLNPSMPENGLVDACRQVKQVAITEAENAERLAQRVQALEGAAKELLDELGNADDIYSKILSDDQARWALCPAVQKLQAALQEPR